MNIEIAREVVENLEVIKGAKKSGQDTEYAVRILVDYVSKTGSTGEYLNDLAKSILANPPDNEKGQLAPIELTPDTLLTSEFLIGKINHWVELVRTEIFGSSQAPFNSNGEAARWIRAQEHAERWIQGPEHRKLSPQEQMGELRKLIQSGHFKFEMRSMPYVGEDGKQCYATVTGPRPKEWTIPQTRQSAHRFTSLSWLESETRMMSHATGFTQLGLVQFVLTGSKPILERYETAGRLTFFKLPNQEELRPTWVEINIRTKDLSFRELQEIYAQHRKYLQLQRGKTLNEKHLALYLLVNGKGGPQKRKGTVAFWNSVKNEWNRLNPNDKYQSWKGIKQNYERVIQRLKDRFESNTLGKVPQEGGTK